MSDIVEQAITYARQALEILESQASSARMAEYKRLIPPLSVNFARAGELLSDHEILNLVSWAEEEGVPLRELFKAETKLDGNQPLTYNAIARRLIPDFAPPDLEAKVQKGDVSALKVLMAKKNLAPSYFDKILDTAAKKGHLEVVLHCVDHCSNPYAGIRNALEKAAKEKQFHCLQPLLDKEIEIGGYTASSPYDLLNADTQSEYSGFKRLYNDFKKNSGALPGDYFTGLESWQNVPLKLRAYLKIRNILRHEIESTRDLNRMAFKTALVLQSPERVLKLLDKWGERGNKPLYTLLKDMDPPITKWVNWPSWGDALLKFGKAMYFPMTFANQLHTPARTKKGEISLRLTRDTIWNNYYPQDPASIEVAALCFEHQTLFKTLESALKLWHETRRPVRPDPADSIPDINMTCAAFGLKGYSLKKIPYTDPRIMFLGYYTGCCEKIGDHFEETVRDALLTRTSGYYVLMKDDEIRCHSWVWRGEDGQLIIDGWETRDPEITAPKMQALTNALAKQLRLDRYEEYNITDILIGPCGEQLKDEIKYPKAQTPAMRRVCGWYFDGNFESEGQWTVSARADRHPAPWSTHRFNHR